MRLNAARGEVYLYSASPSSTCK